MSVSVRFHREDPWELIRLMRAATPTTLLNFITTGMRFIAWQPCDEDVMRLAYRCVVRNGIRRFQFAEPATTPTHSDAPPGSPRGGCRGDRRRADLLDQPGAHPRLLRRAGRGARGLRRHRSLLPQGPGRPLDDGCRPRAGRLRRHGTHGGASRPLHDGLAPLAYLEGLRAASTCCTRHRPRRRRDLPADGRVDDPQPRRRGLRHALDTDSSRPCARTSRRSWRKGPPGRCAARVRRRVLPPPAARRMVATTRRMLEEIRRPTVRRGTRQGTARRAEMGSRILVAPVSQLVAFQATRDVIDPERWLNVSNRRSAISLDTSGHLPRRPTRTSPTGCSRFQRSTPTATPSRSVSTTPARGSGTDLGRGAPAAADHAAGAGRHDAGRAVDLGAAVAGPRRGSRTLVRLLRELERRSGISYARSRRTTTW